MSNRPKSLTPRRPWGRSRRGPCSSLTQVLRRAAVDSLLTTGGVVAGFAVATCGFETLPLSTTDIVTSHEGSESEDPVQALIDAHDCWTDGATMPPDMRGRYPGHVIVTMPRHHEATYSAALVGTALEHVFGTGTGPNMTVHAFCR